MKLSFLSPTTWVYTENFIGKLEYFKHSHLIIELLYTTSSPSYYNYGIFLSKEDKLYTMVHHAFITEPTTYNISFDSKKIRMQISELIITENFIKPRTDFNKIPVYSLIHFLEYGEFRRTNTI